MGRITEDRYTRQISVLGLENHKKLREKRVAIVGCGGMGCVVGSSLARSGVNLTLIDDDRVEPSNLQRQELFSTPDVGEFKVARAGVRLLRINPGIRLRLESKRLTHENAEQLLAEADVIADCTDNMASRFIINEWAIKLGKPWVYGGVTETEGRVWGIIPGQTPCFFCIMELSICGTPDVERGVLGAAVGMVGSMQALEVIKLLTGNYGALSGYLAIDCWTSQIRRIEVKKNEKCRCNVTRPT
jgi:adenylyltransferase/sulfurtransferase